MSVLTAQTALPQLMRIIGTALQATKDPALNGTYATVDNCVTFYAETKKAAFVLRQQWLSKQKNTIAIIGVDNLSEHRGLHEESSAGAGAISTSTAQELLSALADCIKIETGDDLLRRIEALENDV